MSVEQSVTIGFWKRAWRRLFAAKSLAPTAVPMAMSKGWALQVPQLKLVATQPAVAAASVSRPIPCKFEALLSPAAQPHDFTALLLPTPPPERFDWLALAKPRPRNDFRLAARLASAQTLNAPKHRRDGKGPVTPPNFGKAPQSKARPKAAPAIVKKSIRTKPGDRK